jgi:DNA-binding FadR family transcriptional regulator
VWTIDRLLTEACPNTRLKKILDSFARQTLRYSQLGLSTPQRRRESVQHWQQLVAAIRRGDGAAAERIARERVTDSRDGAIKVLHQAARPEAVPKMDKSA